MRVLLGCSSYMLHAQYLIFGYEMTDDGYVRIKNLWLKELWTICRCMEKWALNLQIKGGVVHKIRPAVWYSKKNFSISTFRKLRRFYLCSRANGISESENKEFVWYMVKRFSTSIRTTIRSLFEGTALGRYRREV